MVCVSSATDSSYLSTDRKNPTTSKTEASTIAIRTTDKEKDREVFREREREGVNNAGSADVWQSCMYTSEDIINEEDRIDAFLSSVCATIKRIILSEVQKKDLEMVANVILYTLSCKERPILTTPRRSDGKKSDCYARTVGMSGGSNKDTEGESGKQFLPPMGMLRVYLLRLLFVMYDEHIKKIVLKSTPNKSMNTHVKDVYQVCTYVLLSSVFTTVLIRVDTTLIPVIL